MKIIIIEDEHLMSDALRDEIVSIDPSIEIVAQLYSIKEALRYLDEAEFPDLFFADIELSDGLSFEIFKRTNNKVPIIFCTAYNHYALEAFKVYGVDYILKPFDRDAIQVALEKFRSLVQVQPKSSLDYSSIVEVLERKMDERKNSILIHKGDKIIPLPASKVALAQLDTGIVYVYTFDNDRYPVNYNMDRLFQLLGNNFYRVNRQFIIHRDNVDHASRYFARKLMVRPKIAFKEDLIISKANTSEFLKWLESH